jgi:hypothetical protein
LRLSAAGSHIAIVLLTDFQIVAMLQNSDQCSDALHLPIWIPQAFVTRELGLHRGNLNLPNMLDVRC